MSYVMISALRATTLLFLLLGLSACVSPGIQSVNSTADLKSDEIIVVGKIKLVPKFVPGEQVLESYMFGKDQVEGKAFIMLSDEFRDLSDTLGFSDVGNMASVEFRKTFMVAAKRTKPLIFSGAFFVVNAGDNYLLPGGLKFNYNKNDKAIYVGTIEFHRNDYDEITKVNIIDEYKQANKAFKKIHGKKIKLKKIKPTLIK